MPGERHRTAAPAGSGGRRAGAEPRRPAAAGTDPAAGARARRQAVRSNAVVRRHPRAARAWGRLHARILALSRGRVLGRWLGAPVAVIETVGRRSGKVRRTPILVLREGERRIAMAANAGSPRTPAWLLNARAAGGATLIERGRRVPVRLRDLAPQEVPAARAAFERMHPAAAHYGALTEREIPLVALEPAAALSDAYLAAWQARDPDRIVALHSAETVFHLHAGGGPRRGRAAVREAFAAILAAWPGFTARVHRIHHHDEGWTLDWSLDAELPGGPGEPARPVSLRCLDLVEVGGGLVERKDTFVDLDELRAILAGYRTDGVVRAPGAEAPR